MVFWFLVSWVYVITVWSGSKTLFVVAFSPELFGWDEYDRILAESELDLIFAELSARRVTERARVGSHKFNVELSQWVMGAVLLGECGESVGLVFRVSGRCGAELCRLYCWIFGSGRFH